MNLRDLLGKASPARSGDELAGLAAATAEERVRARLRVADAMLTALFWNPDYTAIALDREQSEVRTCGNCC
jgi:ethanolamine ammonia-lyase large subunit